MPFVYTTNGKGLRATTNKICYNLIICIPNHEDDIWGVDYYEWNELLELLISLGCFNTLSVCFRYLWQENLLRVMNNKWIFKSSVKLDNILFCSFFTKFYFVNLQKKNQNFTELQNSCYITLKFKKFQKTFQKSQSTYDFFLVSILYTRGIQQKTGISSQTSNTFH